MGPEILRKAEELDAAPVEERLDLSLRLINKLVAVDGLLDKFRQNLEDSRGPPLYWPQPASRGGTDDSQQPVKNGVRAIALWHQDTETASTFIFFWTMVTMVWSGLTDLYTGLYTSGAGHILERMAPALGQQTNWIVNVRNILQSLEYLQADNKQNAGTLRISVFLNIIIDVMDGKAGYDEEYQWTLEVRQSNEERLRMMKYDRKSRAASSSQS